MRAIRFRIGALLLAVFSLFALKPATAQMVVIDPANLAQNIIEVLHLIQSNANEASMIANQILSLENEALNLEFLDFSIIPESAEQLKSLLSAIRKIDGLMQHLSDLEEKFDRLYPDFTILDEQVDGYSLRKDSLERLHKTRDMVRGSVKASAKVVNALSVHQTQIEELMNRSQQAVGILQATQAGNQIAGSVASQLINLNAQIATLIQAHTSQMMEANGAALATRNRLDHALDDWGLPYVKQPIEDNPF